MTTSMLLATNSSRRLQRIQCIARSFPSLENCHTTVVLTSPSELNADWLPSSSKSKSESDSAPSEESAAPPPLAVPVSVLDRFRSILWCI